jgi:hypothetical protein
LRQQGVGPGDVFLFFGWFKEVMEMGRGYAYRPDGPNRHIIFGWFQIGQRIAVADRAALPPWALYHPHCQGPPYSPTDSLYIAADRLDLDGLEIDRPGAGVFTGYDEQLCLTRPGALRSLWRLPSWFDPGPTRPPLTYHGNPRRWSAAETEDQVHLQTVGRGQEFVLDCEEYPEAIAWLANLLKLAD